MRERSNSLNVCVFTDCFGDVCTGGFIEEGRRDWVVGLKVWSKDESDDYIGIDCI